jgi:hypothetical protein
MGEQADFPSIEIIYGRAFGHPNKKFAIPSEISMMPA